MNDLVQALTLALGRLRVIIAADEENGRASADDVTAYNAGRAALAKVAGADIRDVAAAVMAKNWSASECLEYLEEWRAELDAARADLARREADYARCLAQFQAENKA
jgi:hypothetical protein